MTVNYKLDAMLELRKYLWAKLKTAGIFDEDAYWSDNIGENIIPILPVQQYRNESIFEREETYNL